MKKEIHPTYYPKATITCACGTAFKVGSTKEETKVELCSNCHPFYTGKQKFVDTQGRLDRFKKKLAKTEEMASQRKGVKDKAVKKAVKSEKQEKKIAKKTIKTAS